MDCEYEALCFNAHGLTESEVVFEFSKTYNQIFDDETQSLINQEWEVRQKENPHLFNGNKFRLHEIAWQNAKPIVRLGLTTYRDYIGTNCNERRTDLQTKGMTYNGNSQAFMADPLGVGTLLCSRDDNFIFLTRSQICGEAQGLLDGPGGHAEPDMIPGLLSDTMLPVSSEIIAKEIFNSIMREVVDEMNIPMSSLSEPRLLGVTKNNTTGGRRSFEFIIRCDLTSDEIVNYFNEGTQPEADESTAIHVLSEQQLVNLPPGGPLTWNAFAPAAKGRWQLYRYLKSK